MRKFLFIYLVAACSVLFAQSDSLKKERDLRVGLDGQSMLATKGGLAYSGRLLIRYRAGEVGCSFGSKSRFIKNVGTYDIITCSGRWVEPNFGVLFPIDRPKDKSFLARGDLFYEARAAFGFCTSDNTYTAIFEAKYPYEPYIYQKSYKNVKTQYGSVSFGTRYEAKNRLRFGAGITADIIGIDEHDRRPDAQEVPFIVTPKGSAGLYFNVGVML